MPSELEGLIFPYFFAENRILGCLGSILEASWAVLANFLGRLGPPRHLQDALKSARIGPKSLPRGVYKLSPKRLGGLLSPRSSQKLPRTLQTSILVPPDLDFGGFFHDFGKIFGVFNPHLLPLLKVFGG